MDGWRKMHEQSKSLQDDAETYLGAAVAVAADGVAGHLGVRLLALKTGGCT